MQLFVNGLQTTVLQVSENDTILSVKEHLANSDGIPVEDQVLTHAGSPLEDSNTLQSYGISDLASLSLEVRLLGGKHCSLRHIM